MKVKKDLVVLDLETTGTWIERDKIIEIAMVKIIKSGGEEKYFRRINPGMPIPKQVTEITGITNDDVKHEKIFEQIAGEILEFLGSCDIGGFNVLKFDLPVLAREFSKAGLYFEYESRDVYDAQKIYHIYEKRNLTAAYKFYCGKDLVDAHSAEADARATLDILAEQSKKYANDNFEDLKHIDYEQKTEFFDRQKKFRWWNGRLYIMFGKYGRKLSLEEVIKKDRPYVEWMLAQDFEEPVKEMLRSALIGRMPAVPK